MKTLSKLSVILPLVILAITSHSQTIEKKSLDPTGAKKAIAAAVDYAKKNNAPGGVIAVSIPATEITMRLPLTAATRTGYLHRIFDPVCPLSHCHQDRQHHAPGRRLRQNLDGIVRRDDLEESAIGLPNELFFLSARFRAAW
jgi:hypothetical protein